MARLNEPSVSPGGLESLKRKFIRQNRDIARVNSTQSLRIRDLENDNSSLLSENLSLREKILRLQSDQENKNIRKIGEKTLRLKAQLESKLLEISALVCDLGQEVQDIKISPTCDKFVTTFTTSSPGDSWKDVYLPDEEVLSPDGRLPPIMEDVNNQMRFSENHDLHNRLDSTEVLSTESPEIESPPKSQFVDTDPVKIDLPIRVLDSEIQDSMAIDPILSVTVEQRRKRKDSLGLNGARRSNHSISILERKESTGSLKKGAKRKINARNEEDSLAKEEIEKEVMSKKVKEYPPTTPMSIKPKMEEIQMANENQNHNQKENGGKYSREPSLSLQLLPQDKENSSERIPLAPKNNNASPRKKSPSMKVDKNKLIVNMNHKILESKGRTRSKVVQIDKMSESRKSIGENTENLNEPDSRSKLQDMKSSTKCSSPSTSTPSNVQVNTPSNLLSVSDNDPPQSDSVRPSRRVRGSVSYAEPNLRQKMRRPTKELADAVVRDRTDQTVHQPRKSEEIVEGLMIKNVDRTQNGKEHNLLTPADIRLSQGAEEPLCSVTKQISQLTVDEKKHNHFAQPTMTEVSCFSKRCPSTSRTSSHRKQRDSESPLHTNVDNPTIEAVESEHNLEIKSNMKKEKNNNPETIISREAESELVSAVTNVQVLSRRNRRSTLREASMNNSNDKLDTQSGNDANFSTMLPSEDSSENRVGVSTRRSLMIR